MAVPDRGKTVVKLDENKSTENEMKQNVHIPWRRLNRAYDSRGIVGLHQEIEDFFKYMTPTIEEHTVRLLVVNRIKTLIYNMWPRAFIEVFGSFATGLYLPTSDIDLVVCGTWNNPPLYALRTALIQYNISEPENVKVLDKAPVPIVKLTDRSSNIRVDITFDMKDAVKSVQVIKDFSYHYPALSKLAFVLKQFLCQRYLNEVFNGGISSYSLLLMIISFLQLHTSNDSKKSEENLGTLLIDFFELYGRKFNYQVDAIRVKSGGSLISKDELRKDTIDGHKPITLSIEDPLTPGNDVGYGSYGTEYAKKEFEMAYLILTSTLSSSNASDANVQSILGRIVSVSDGVVKYRNWVRKNNLLIINAMSLKQNCGREVKSVQLAPCPKSYVDDTEKYSSWRNHNIVECNIRENQPNFKRRTPVRPFVIPMCLSPLTPKPPLLQTPILQPQPTKLFINNKYASAFHQNYSQRIDYSKNLTQTKMELVRPFLLPCPPIDVAFYPFHAYNTKYHLFLPVGIRKSQSKYHHQYHRSDCIVNY